MEIVKTIENRHNYNMIDLWKFLYAYLVIFYHSNPLTNCENMYIVNTVMFLVDMIVPIYLVMAGYFLYCPINKAGVNKIDKLKAYLNKCLKMYVITTLVSFPLSVYGYVESGNSLISCVLSYIKYFLFVGKLYNSYHLGFMLCLIYAIVEVLIFTQLNFKEEVIFCIGLVSYIFYEIMYIAIQNVDQMMGIFEKIVRGYFFVFNYGAIFYSFVYISIGMFIAKYKKYFNIWVSVAGLVIIQIVKIYVEFSITEFMRLVEVVFLFMILCNCSEVAINTCCLWRKNMIQRQKCHCEAIINAFLLRNYEGTE